MGEKIFSPDGKWMWTGEKWIPAPPGSAVKPANPKQISPLEEKKTLEMLEEALSHGFGNPESIPKMENAYRIVSNMEVRSEKIDDQIGQLLMSLAKSYEDIDYKKSINYAEMLFEFEYLEKDGKHAALLHQAMIYSKRNDWPNLARICDMYFSWNPFPSGGANLWDSWRTLAAVNIDMPKKKRGWW